MFTFIKRMFGLDKDVVKDAVVGVAETVEDVEVVSGVAEAIEVPEVRKEQVQPKPRVESNLERKARERREQPQAYVRQRNDRYDNSNDPTVMYQTEYDYSDSTPVSSPSRSSYGSYSSDSHSSNSDSNSSSSYSSSSHSSSSCCDSSSSSSSSSSCD
jgi:hypothetical protein